MIERSLGAIRDTNDTRDYRRIASASPADMPRAFSLPEIIAVCDQGSRSSCMAYAITALWEYCLTTRTSFKGVLSKAYAWSQSQLEDNPGSALADVGCTARSVMSALRKKGAVPLDIYNDEEHWLKVPDMRIETYGKILALPSYERCADLATIKSTLYIERQPILLVMPIFKVFYGEQPQNVFPHPGPEVPPEGYHGVLLYGWDDDRKAIHIQNQWGTSWGFGGRAWLDYAYITGADFDAWTPGKDALTNFV